MKSLPPAILLVALLIASPRVLADNRVVVVASADESYTQRKFGDGKPARETYVYLQGRHFKGATVDNSLDKMPFRQLVSYLTPRLAEQQFFPAKTVAEADLLFLVHWGATNPHVSMFEMMGKTNWTSVLPETDALRLSPGVNDEGRIQLYEGAVERYDSFQRIGDAIAAESRQHDIAQLLGYDDELRKLARQSHASTEEETLRFDLRHERYFVIIRAYDLRASLTHRRPKPVWTVHMNVRSPGNNFRTAMARMSHIGPQFFGTTTDKIRALRARVPDVKVELGDLIVIGDEK